MSANQFSGSRAAEDIVVSTAADGYAIRFSGAPGRKSIGDVQSLPVWASLVELSLRGCPSILDSSIVAVAELRSVRLLDFSGCALLTGTLLPEACFSQLEDVDISYCSSWTTLAPFLASPLTVIDISACCALIPASAVSLFSRLSRLQRVSLRLMTRDKALCSELLRLCLKRCPIRSLLLTGNSYLSDQVLADCWRGTQLLEELDLSGCSSLGNQTILAIADQYSLLRKLKVLILTGLSSVSFSSVALMLSRFEQAMSNSALLVSDGPDGPASRPSSRPSSASSAVSAITRPLVSHPGLYRLELTGTSLTAEEVSSLQEKFPSVEIGFMERRQLVLHSFGGSSGKNSGSKKAGAKKGAKKKKKK